MDSSYCGEIQTYSLQLPAHGSPGQGKAPETETGRTQGERWSMQPAKEQETSPRMLRSCCYFVNILWGSLFLFCIKNSCIKKPCSVLPACMSVHHMYARYLRRPEADTRSQMVVRHHESAGNHTRSSAVLYYYVLL